MRKRTEERTPREEWQLELHRVKRNPARSAHRRAASRGPSSPVYGVIGAATAALAGSALVNTYVARRAERLNPPRGGFLLGAGAELHVVEQGNGTPVVLIHGLGTSLEDMASSGLADAAARQFRVISVDRPGYGHSERLRDRVWGVHEQARAIREAVSRLGVERPIVLGHSFGAMIAMAWAIDAPESLAGLVLLSGYYYPTSRMDLLMLAPPIIPGLGDVMRYTISPWIGRMAAPAFERRMFHPQPVPDRFRNAVPLSMMTRPVTIRAVAEEAALMVPAAEELARHYADLRVPVSLIAGDADIVAPMKHHTEAVADEIKNAKVRRLPGVGHMPHHVATTEVLEEIAAMAGEKLRTEPARTYSTERVAEVR